MNPDRALDYLDFVVERHRIWERRQAGQPGPWTKDPVLATKSFTNVFRILDHDSQWLLTSLLDGSPRDVLMRCFLFRHTGRVEAWNYLFAEIGGAPGVEDLELVREVLKEYRGKTTVHMKATKPEGSQDKAGGFQKKVGERPVFTGAYLVFPQSQVPGTDKLDSIIDLTQRLFVRESVAERFLAAQTQAARFAVLCNSKGVAEFMSMQILTDWNYSPHGADRENEFIVLGPGARRGIREVFGRESVEDLGIARSLLGATMPTLNLGDGVTREPSLMDLQNTFCEFSKYVRGPASKPYAAQHSPVPPQFPTQWRKS